MARLKQRWVIVGIAGVVVIAAVVAVLVVVAGGSSAPRSQVNRYLAAWSSGDTKTMATFLDAPPADLATVATSLLRSVPGGHQTATISHITSRQATYHARMTIPAFGAFDWDGTLALAKGKVTWSEANLYPGLTGDQHLVFHRSWGIRAPIIGADGTPLVSAGPAVTVGVEPDRMTNLAQVQAAFASVLAIDPATVAKAVTAPNVKPNFFVPIATLPTATYDQVRPKLAPVPGIVFQRTTSRQSSIGISQLIGNVGEITADRLKQLGPPYQVGDQVGLSGVEAAYEKQLAGTPTGTVDIVGQGTVVHTAHTYPGTPPQPLQLTIDPHIQQAAVGALANVAQAAALVAIDATTGAIRAVVSTPTSQAFDRALEGAYPPGSTFKVITTTALLASGRTASTPAPCPPQIVVGGKRFTNFDGEAPGAIPLSRAFAISCNTAFIGLAQQLPAGAEGAAAALFGFNTKPTVGVGGSYPTPADQVEAVAAAIGQGRVTASPLQMATVAAAVDAGQWHPPELVASASTASTTPPLDPTIASTLRSLMRLVVTSGTGTAANVPGQPVFGKTGTAEFGNANPPSTHAWFIGFRGDLAFAVLVEGGGVGGSVAAPIAARFLRATS